MRSNNCVATMLLAGFLCSAGQCAPAAERSLALVSAAVQPFVDRHEFAGVVTLVARGDEIIHLDAIGERDREAHDPLQVDDIFWIASMTKPMTATALMILQDEGKLSVDDPVSKYLPEFASVTLKEGGAPKQPVLIRHLLTHTAGLGQLDRRKPETRTLAEQSRLLAAIPLKWEPGSKWEYGAALQVVGRIIEVVSGEPYEVFLQHRIFDPLQMTRTTFHLTPELHARLAHSYKLNDAKDGLVPAEIKYVSTDPSMQQTPMPSGGLFSCARDVHRFYATILNGGESRGVRIVSAEAVRQMTSQQTGDLQAGFTPGCAWGLGWCVVREPQGVTAGLSPGSYGHGGAYGTQVWVDPPRGLVTVLMVQRADIGNSDGSDLRKALHASIAASVGQNR
jgi:CubicO group peptidase (beta-lactamase class C family)